jgi:hypothetical protein
LLITSGDDGRTWSPPVLVIDPANDPLNPGTPGNAANRRAFDPVLWHDPHGTLWLFWAQSSDHTDGRCGVWAITTSESHLECPRWSEPRRLANGIMMNKPTVLSTSEWLMPAAIWSHGGHRHDRLAHEQFSNVYRSTDRGQSWTLIGSAEVPERGCDEHMIVERRDGSLWMLVRTRYGIGQSFSQGPDRGHTWTPGTPTGISGPETRFFIRRLRSGRLLLVYHYATNQRTNLTASLSEDDGLSWRCHLLLDDRAMVSYPDAIETEDGLIYLIYDRQRVSEREILLAAFTEPDVLAGRVVSPRSRLRTVINRAC